MNILNILQTNNLIHLLLTKSNSEHFFNQVGDCARNLSENLARLLSRLTVFASKITSDDEQVKIRVDELEIHIGRISSIAEVLNTFLAVESWNDDIHYIEIERHGNVLIAALKIAPIDVAPVLKEALFKKVDSILCTSATMDLNDDFRYWSSSVGLPLNSKPFIKKIYKSPFDYEHRLMLLTPYDAPDFNNENQDEYADYLCETIYSAVSSSSGGSLVLFTSIKLMEHVFENLKPRLGALGINCYRQGETERFSLLQKFRQDTDSVLFATDSFWEGVDAPGNTLRMVIISKLPFRMPDEPIYKARLKKMEDEGISGFFALSLPDATMKLKQGYGRLMRHTTDKGIVLILDSRIVKKSYGPAMINSLPQSYYPETSLGTLSERIESFLF